MHKPDTSIPETLEDLPALDRLAIERVVERGVQHLSAEEKQALDRLAGQLGVDKDPLTDLVLAHGRSKNMDLSVGAIGDKLQKLVELHASAQRKQLEHEVADLPGQGKHQNSKPRSKQADARRRKLQKTSRKKNRRR